MIGKYMLNLLLEFKERYKLGTCGSDTAFPFEILMCQKKFLLRQKPQVFGLACGKMSYVCIQGLCDAIDGIGDG